MLRWQNPLIQQVSTEPAALPDKKNPAPNCPANFITIPKSVHKYIRSGMRNSFTEVITNLPQWDVLYVRTVAKESHVHRV
jgi:hypothetical protein